MNTLIIIALVVIVVIFLFKKKKNDMPATLLTIETKGRSETVTTPEYETANDLVKQATALKSENIQLAIDKIKEAIRIDHDSNKEVYYKLASYLHLSYNKEEAFNVINERLILLGVDSFDFSSLNEKAYWCDKIAMLKYRDKDFVTCIKTEIYGTYYNLAICAIQGTLSDLKEINNDFKTKKFSKNFEKSLSQIANKDAIIATFTNYLNENMVHFISMAKIQKSIDFFKLMEKDAMNGINTDGDYEHRILSKNKAFTDAYNKVSESSFVEFFNKNIQVLL